MARVPKLCMTYEEAAERFSYDPETGEFITVMEVTPTYPKGEARAPVFMKPKSTGKAYPCIKINGAYHRATHLAYLLMEKELPEDDMAIYAADGDLANLRWSNLEVVFHRRKAAPVGQGGN